MTTTRKLATVPSGTGFLKISSDIENPVAQAAGGGGGSPGGSTDEVQINDGAGGFGGATNVLAGSGFISIGTAPASVGALRFTLNQFLYSGGFGVDFRLIGLDSGGTTRIGDPSFGDVAVDLKSNGAFGLLVNSSAYAVLYDANASLATNAYPVLGRDTPYGVHGDITITMADADLVLDSTQYSKHYIKFDVGDLTASRSVTLPQPAVGMGYTKILGNNTAYVLAFLLGDLEVEVDATAGQIITVVVTNDDIRITATGSY